MRRTRTRATNITYKNYNITNERGFYEVVNPKTKNRFIVALDDSKVCGHKKIIPKADNVKTAKKYIDWVTK